MAKLSIEFETKGAQDAIAAFHNLSKAEQSAVREVLELDKASGRAERSTKQAAQTGQAEFGKLAQQIVGVASAHDIALKGVQKLIEKYRELREERRQAAEFGKTAAQAEAELNQLAAGDPKRKAELDAIRARFQKETGIDRGKAAGLTFAAASTGFDSDADIQTLIDLQKNLGTEGDARVLLEAAAGLKTALGEDEVGSLREQIIKLQTAGNISQKDPKAIAQQALRAAPGASLQGISDEELQATIAATIGGLGESTGSSVNAFLQFLATNDEFKGQSIQEATAAIQAKGLSSSQLAKFIGSTDALAGFNSISKNLDQIAAGEQALTVSAGQAGTSADLLNTTNATRSDLQIAAEKEAIARQEKENEQVDREAVKELELQAEISRVKAKEIEEGVPVADRVIRGSARDAVDALGGPASTIEPTSDAASDVFGRGSNVAVLLRLGEAVLNVLGDIRDSRTNDERPTTSGGAP